jgi:hypothetical protein
MKKNPRKVEPAHPMLRRTFLSGAGANLSRAAAFTIVPARQADFDDSGPLSETVLMENLAVRFPNRLLLWDGDKMEVTSDPEANAYVRREYRAGWTQTE